MTTDDSSMLKRALTSSYSYLYGSASIHLDPNSTAADLESSRYMVEELRGDVETAKEKIASLEGAAVEGCEEIGSEAEAFEFAC
ncbi:hypothetical protein P7C70_g1618, partial [Phenoliferia sp. Uapishka_3]